MEAGGTVKLIFKIVGVLVLTLLLFNFIFGVSSTRFIYDGMTSGYQVVWKDSTSNNGKNKTAVMTTLFNNANSKEE